MEFKATHLFTSEYGYTKNVMVTEYGLIFDEFEYIHHLPCAYKLINDKVYKTYGMEWMKVTATVKPL